MPTRTQLFIFFLLSLAGTAFAWYLQSFINWSGALEWIKKVQLYEFLGAVVIVIAFILIMWVNEEVCKRIKDRADRDISTEEHKNKVANSLRSREPVDVE